MTKDTDTIVREATALLLSELNKMRRERDDAWKRLNVKDDTIAKQREEIERLRVAVSDWKVAYEARTAENWELVAELNKAIAERDHLQWAAEQHFATQQDENEINFASLSEVEVPNDDEVVSYGKVSK